MDPDAALAAIQHLAKEILTGVYDQRERISLADALAERVLDLDDWLQKAGALPKEWQDDNHNQPVPGDRRPIRTGRVRARHEDGNPPPLSIRRG